MGVRASTVLVLWVLATSAAAAHGHDRCDGDGHDGAPCSICIVIHEAPLLALPAVEADVREPLLIAWITPWIALVPEEAFFDRPLGRGPPARV